MAGEWNQVTFADVIELISGGTPKTGIPEYWGGYIPWLSIADFNTGYRWVSIAEKKITERGLTESATTILRQGDIIISARGTVGVVAQLTRPMAFNQSCYGIRGKQGIAETNFIYYALRYAMVQMQQVAHGGVFNTITRDTFKIITTKLPPIQEQRAIAHILGTLDDKIENNRRMNETLEQMARAIFKSWFVDFDPVRANMERKDSTQRRQGARTQKGEGQLSSLASSRLCGFALNPEIAALFPDSFEDSELGEIPKGWRVESFTNDVDVIGGGTPKTSHLEYWGGNIPWFSVVDTPATGEVFVRRTEKTITQDGVDNSSTRVLPIGTTIISARGTVGNLALVAVPMTMNQSCYGLHDSRGNNGYYLYYATEAVVETLRQRTHGSVFNTITCDTLKSVRVITPPNALIAEFERIVGSMLQRNLSSLCESHTLADLRDTLLPKLISGELRVKDAERIAGGCI